MLWTPVPPALTLGKDEEARTWDFLTVVGSSQAEAQACLAEALQLQAQGTLYIAHAQAWAQFWAGCGLDVAGPLALRQVLRGSLYYLLSALPQPGTPGYICHGLSPGGLSNGSQEECYWGHIFWDQVCIIPQHQPHSGQHIGIEGTAFSGSGLSLGDIRAMQMGRLS
jgi:trehalose/maltose hydrolase-like predicted phosphorylase